MPAGHFDNHIAAIDAAKISEDYSEFIECHDCIKSIMDLNARKQTMPADDFIATEAAISDDFSKIQCYDLIESIRKLTMSADDYIAAIDAAKISEDLSKIECYDRIKSIMDLNALNQR